MVFELMSLIKIEIPKLLLLILNKMYVHLPIKGSHIIHILQKVSF